MTMTISSETALDVAIVTSKTYPPSNRYLQFSDPIDTIHHARHQPVVEAMLLFVNERTAASSENKTVLHINKGKRGSPWEERWFAFDKNEQTQTGRSERHSPGL